MEPLWAGYAEAVVREMEGAGGLPIGTVYFGGGTPSVLPPLLLERIVEGVRRSFDTSAVCEMSIEANPGTVDGAALAGLVRMGFTRLSLGVQSFFPGELALLGRIHSAAQAEEAVREARRAGFGQVSLDLMYGLPGQSAAGWQASLEAALALRPDHLSLYALSVEEGTPLAEAVAAGRVEEPDADVAADLYEQAERLLEAEGWWHYEISNWARSEAEVCRHNLVYWRNEPYVGLGAGAHSWGGGRRWANGGSPAAYIERVMAGGSPVEFEEEIPEELEVGETMMLGLRLVQEGVEEARFRARFGAGLRERFGGEIDDLVARGLLAADERGIRLSERGRLLGNQVFLRFLPG
jgi:oxygen-independent coproporphyrinogen-3 oxidase